MTTPALPPDPVRLLALADAVFVAADGLRVDGERGGPPPTAGEIDELARCAGLDRTVAVALREAAVRNRTDRAAIAAERTRLFDGATPCPPNETAWIRRDKGHLLGDIAGFYGAFGFRAARDSAEKADHLVTELQFVAVLLAMVARAAERDQAEVARSALVAFAEDHTGAWIEPFCERLAALAVRPELHALAIALVGIWRSVLASVGVLVRPQPGPTPTPAADDGTPYECDGGPCDPSWS